MNAITPSKGAKPSGRTLSKEEIEQLAADVERVSASMKLIAQEINDKVLWGQKAVVDLTLTGMLAGGHIDLEGDPGLGKTLLLENIAPILNISFKRVQFTPDLMPGDILGSEILKEINGEKKFAYEPGPIHTMLLMADEINRASPKTQAALLQAMQEYKVDVGGVSYYLPRPFHVVATQNPLEQEGTYPLPEAQLDRFLLKIDMDYPDAQSEMRIIEETTSSSFDKYRAIKAERQAGGLSKRSSGGNNIKVNSVLEPDFFVEAQELAKVLPLSEEFVTKVKNIVRHLRPSDEGASKLVQDNVGWGPGPRAGQAFAKAARARALIRGQLSPDLSDIKALAVPVLGHRMKLTYAARAGGLSEKEVIEKIVDQELGL